MKKFLIVLTFLSGYFISITAQKTVSLSFNKDGQFKIVQFTDLHWSHTSPGCEKTEKTIRDILKSENPDLVILTGDIVTNTPAYEAWGRIAAFFEEYKTPWSITLGNHDAESGLTREKIFEILENKPYFIGEKGPKLTGCGNYSIPIKSSADSSTAAVLYCFDSNNKPLAHKYGDYDWIHFDQIQWYREQSDQYTRLANKTLPSLAFFHIPLLEFNQVVGKENTIGIKKEGIASPAINSGLFCSMVEKKDVMGVFVEHDHNNDYIGIEQDIALAFGRVTGSDAYGELERGGRVIVLYEDAFRFDSWIRTSKSIEFMYYFPSGISRKEEKEAVYLPSTDIKIKKQGVAYTYYEGRPFKHTSDIQKAVPVSKGTLSNISLAPALSSDSMAFEFNTWIQISETGIYNFYTYSDDGSKLFIDDVLVVDNDGSHSLRRKEGRIGLEKGFHKLKVLYFENYMGERLEVGYSGKNIREDILPDYILYLAE